MHIIWDFDGTLVDSEREIVKTINLSLEYFGIAYASAKSPYRIGPPLEQVLSESFSPDILGDDLRKQIVQRFREIYDKSEYNETVPFPGIEEILRNKLFTHHIVTNKPDLATRRILDKLHWAVYFDMVLTPYTFMENGKKKSKTELFELIKGKYPGDDFLGIGDMISDCHAAVNNDIPFLGVLWGTGTLQDFECCDCIKVFYEADTLNAYLIQIARNGI